MSGILIFSANGKHQGQQDQRINCVAQIAANLEQYSWLELAEYHVRTIALIFQYTPESIENTLRKIQSILKNADLPSLFR